LIDDARLKVFDSLEPQIIVDLFKDFYRIRRAWPYEYDFSVMSKHALSRIYERYTNLLRIPSPDIDQPRLFKDGEPLPEEQPNLAYGSIYTPQFIARFFARFLYEQMPPFAFKRLHALEPAVGSGMFLRTLLELQCDPIRNGLTTSLIESAFANVIGLDCDPNACHAALLSLSLLHFVLTNHLPEQLAIYPAEAIAYFLKHPDLRGSQDVVIANPPFISWGGLRQPMRELVAEFMGPEAGGRIDLYLAFLKIAVEALKPGGYGLFVLPHNFLLANNALGMRKLISETSWIRCLADLSAVPVFEDKGSYIVLLIFQKRFNVEPVPDATIVRCRELVGRALQDAAEGHLSEGALYSVYNVPQDAFRGGNWVILPPTESAIRRKLECLPALGQFLEIHQGLISGKDEVFILPASESKRVERRLFVPFLPDREMNRYVVPEKTSWYVFYPFINGRKIEEAELRAKFPKTWTYLLENKEALESRPPVLKGRLPWWQPERPRLPGQMMRPKIISPHLVVLPRFALDRDGKYAVSRAPLMYPRPITPVDDLLNIIPDPDSAEDTGSESSSGIVEDDLLRWFTAILNSGVCYRLIAQQSHRYGSGYAMLEPRTLALTPVPNPGDLPPAAMQDILKMVDRRLAAREPDAIGIEAQIESMVADVYGLNNDERTLFGVQSKL
jgi:hypothetical protein